MSSDKENEYFSDGVTEEIINALAKNNNLQVTSRTSSFYFKGKNIDVQKIGAQLNVTMVLEGSVRKSGNNVRVTVQLINTKDGFHYWSESYNHQLDDIFHVQDQISSQVAEKVREYLGHFQIDEQKVAAPDNIDIYELYLKSRYNFNKLQVKAVEIAANQIEQVVEVENNCSQYYAAKGMYYSYLGLLNALPFKEAFKIARTASLKALSIDDTNAEAHHSISIVKLLYDGDITQAQFHNELALHFKPSYPDALMGKTVLAVMSENIEPLNGIRKAIRLDPLSPSLKYYYAALLLRLNKLDEALIVINKMLSIIPYHTNSYSLKGVILTRLGEYKKAINHYKNVPISKDKNIEYNSGLGIVYASMGDKNRAIEYLKKVHLDYQNINVFYEENAAVIINILLNNFDEAFKHIDIDIIEKKYYLKYYKSNPIFNLLKKDKRYRMLQDIFITKGKQTKEKSKKYLKSGIKQEKLDEINERLIQLMQNKKPYLNDNINLKSLAESLSESANHVSQVINDSHKKNFFDFINTYRIQEMVGLLKIPKNKHLTLLALAYDAGFNSKTTFNTAFKKLKGKTPSQYFKELNLIN
jgi:TolB-like protein/AraC-like DNA-binding protein